MRTTCLCLRARHVGAHSGSLFSLPTASHRSEKSMTIDLPYTCMRESHRRLPLGDTSVFVSSPSVFRSPQDSWKRRTCRKDMSCACSCGVKLRQRRISTEILRREVKLEGKIVCVQPHIFYVISLTSSTLEKRDFLR